MLFVNDDTNNDELFRRAAENYPLKTDNPDWDAVLAKMNTANTGMEEPAPADKKRKKNHRYLLLLLLLIPLAIFETKTSYFRDMAGKHDSQGKPGNISSSNPGTASTDNSNTATIPAGDNKLTGDQNILLTATTTSTSGAVDQKENLQEKPDQPVSTTDPAKNTARNVVAGNKQETSLTSSNKRRYGSKQKSAMKISAAETGNEEVVVVQYPDTKNKLKNKNLNSKSVTVESTSDNTTTTQQSPEQKKIAAKQKITIAGADAETSSAVADKDDKDAGKDKTVKEEQVTTAADKKQTDKKESTDKPLAKEDKKKQKQKHFYVGAIAGPDFSAVKLQSLKRTGMGYGLLAGYRITRKLSVETGILQDKKYYSTAGRYFDPKGMNLPAYYSLEYVDGTCKMLEVPLNITYTFRQGSRSGWFGSVGASSYFMQNESYRCDVVYNNYRYSRDWDYNTKSTNIFSVINISGGYTYKLGRIGTIRLEPYVKIPVRKIGTGKLPIQSGGIYLGFIKDIF